MNAIAQAIVAPESEIVVAKDNLVELEDLRARLFKRLPPDSAPSSPLPRLASVKSVPDEGVRFGRQGKLDRARAIILAMPGKFTHVEALAAINKAGLGFKNAYTVLASLIKAKKLDKFSSSEYFVPGPNATAAAAAVAKPEPVKRKKGRPPKPTPVAPVAALPLRGVLKRSQPANPIPDDGDLAAPEPPAPTGSVSDILQRHNVLIEDMDPFHPGAIEIGRTFHGDFTLTDARARIGPKQAGYWLARWKETGWIETVGLSTYRRTEKFPVRQSSPGDGGGAK